jgi:hypothetical protein
MTESAAVVDAPELAPSDDVEVQVGDGLAASSPDIGRHPVAVGDALVIGDPAGQAEATGQQFTVVLGELVHGGDVLDGYDEIMDGRLGELVAYGDDALVGADVLGRLVVRSDPAEEAVL